MNHMNSGATLGADPVASPAAAAGFDKSVTVPESEPARGLTGQPSGQLSRQLPPRMRRRRRLLLTSAPVVVIAAVIAVKLLSLPVSAAQASQSWGDGNAEGTVRAGGAMGVMNIVERYKAHLALGDGYVLREDYEAAHREFVTALDLVPANESCKVRVNLVLTLEKLGEAHEKAGDPASAKDLFSQGSTLVAEAPRDCFAANSENNSEGEGEQLKDAQKRLQEKQQAGQDGQEKPSNDGSESNEAQQAPADKLDQLEKSGQEAQQQRSQSEKLKDTYSKDEQEQYDKPW